jgi:hypothetical protein
MLMVLILAGIAHGEALAQEITGALQGTVVSAGGGPEPQVAVTLSGPNLQGTRATATDTRGFYQFLAVPPGTYKLQLTRVGLQPIDVQQITVELGRTTAVPTLTTAAQPIAMEPVVVQAPRITLDPAHTGAGGTLRTQEYASLPVDRDYKSIIAILPQANTSYRGDPVNVAGSTGLENQYYIDGVNVTDVKLADRATSLPYNFVRAVEVKTGGYEAQYGRALGAVVNALTYSGTNDFEMNVFGFTQPSRLAMDARVAPGISARQPVSYDFGARVGGPLVRDRLWYSAAVNPRTDRIDKEIVGFGSFADRTKAVRFASKLTWRAGATTNVELSVFGDPTVRDQVDPLWTGTTSVTNPDGLLARVESGGTTASLRATVAPSASVLLQGSLSRQWDRYSNQPATLIGRSEVAYNDFTQGSSGGGRFIRSEEDRGRTSLAGRGTLVVPGHTVVAGMDYEDARLFSSNHIENVNRLDTSLFQHSLEGYRGTFHHRSPAAYLQDSWRITDRLTVNPGLRWSGQYLVGASGRTAQRITDEWQPRLGFSWQPGPAATQRIFGSYGRFYQALPINLTTMWFVDYLAVYSNYSTDPRQPGAVPDTVIDASSLEADWAKQIPGLHAENFNEFTLGYERLLGAETKATVRATRRDLRSSFQWGSDPSRNNVWVLGTPGQGDFKFLPPPKRQYTAIEIAAEGSWSRWQYRTSYVLSRTWGNYPGLFNSDFGFANPGNMGTFFAPWQARNSTGLLPNDRPHVFKLDGTYTSRFGLAGGVVLTFESGAPINDFAAGPWGPLAPSFSVQRGSAGRTPALWDLGIRVAYELPVVRRSRVQVLLDVLHVGNPRRAVTVDEVHYATLDENGNPASPNARYRQATAYQPPMAVRLGIQASL